MLPEVKIIDEMDRMTYDFLCTNLTGITDEELDWRLHPEANTVRWIVGHLIWYEEWASDAIEGMGTYLTDRSPSAVEFDSLEDVLTRFDAARDRFHSLVTEFDESDWSREIDYFGEFDVTLRGLAAIHSLHMSGHQYQVRYIRGAFSRERGTDKSVFDPW